MQNQLLESKLKHAGSKILHYSICKCSIHIADSKMQHANDRWTYLTFQQHNTSYKMHNVPCYIQMCRKLNGICQMQHSKWKMQQTIIQNIRKQLFVC